MTAEEGPSELSQSFSILNSPRSLFGGQAVTSGSAGQQPVLGAAGPLSYGSVTPHLESHSHLVAHSLLSQCVSVLSVLVFLGYHSVGKNGQRPRGPGLSLGTSQH